MRLDEHLWKKYVTLTRNAPMQNFSGEHERDIRLPAFPSHSGFFVLLRHDRADVLVEGKA